MDDMPKRPWWRKKRWIAAAVFVLTLPIVYPASVGIASYCVGRGIVPGAAADLAEIAYTPLFQALEAANEVPQLESFSRAFMDWSDGLMELGERHSGRPRLAVGPPVSSRTVIVEEGGFVGLQIEWGPDANAGRPAAGAE